MWLILIARLSAVALTASATFAVRFYLGLQEQQRLTAAQTELLAAKHGTIETGKVYFKG